MPIKLTDPESELEARIEIIPLIDIMFFLLASFMLVSLSMVHLRAIKVQLPTAVSALADSAQDVADVSIDADGRFYLDRQSIGDSALIAQLVGRRQFHHDLRVPISGDKSARHEAVMHALDLIRLAGIQSVAFELQPTSVNP